MTTPFYFMVKDLFSNFCIQLPEALRLSSQPAPSDPDCRLSVWKEALRQKLQGSWLQEAPHWHRR